MNTALLCESCQRSSFSATRINNTFTSFVAPKKSKEDETGVIWASSRYSRRDNVPLLLDGSVSTRTPV